MTKEMLLAKIDDIQEMDEEELAEFGYVLSISHLDPKPRYFLSKAIDIRALELDKRKALGSAVIKSDIKTEDLE